MNATRYIAKCKACNTVTSALSVGQDCNRAKSDHRREGTEPSVYMHPTTGSHVLDCRMCGKARSAKMVRGKLSVKHICNAKCMSSTGFQCDCSCGGKNHGASFAA